MIIFTIYESINSFRKVFWNFKLFLFSDKISNIQIRIPGATIHDKWCLSLFSLPGFFRTHSFCYKTFCASSLHSTLGHIYTFHVQLENSHGKFSAIFKSEIFRDPDLFLFDFSPRFPELRLETQVEVRCRVNVMSGGGKGQWLKTGLRLAPCSSTKPSFPGCSGRAFSRRWMRTARGTARRRPPYGRARPSRCFPIRVSFRLQDRKDLL